MTSEFFKSLYSVHRAGAARDAAVELSGPEDRAGAVFRLTVYG